MIWVTMKRNLKMKKGVKKLEYGGRGEIRTLGRFAPTQPFQGCTIGHSDTRPYLKNGSVSRKYLRVCFPLIFSLKRYNQFIIFIRLLHA